jgi:hypothetical protein
MFPPVEVEVIGLKKSATINAFVDTLFSGFLCIPTETAKDLGLVLCSAEKYELGNGDSANLQRSGSVPGTHQRSRYHWLGQRQTANWGAFAGGLPVGD